MKRFIAFCAIVVCSTAMAHAQGFPDAEKQPKPVEMHRNQKHYKHMAHRRHVSRRLNHDVAAPRKRT
jgi:hypothetical protein